MYTLTYLQTICFTECFITPITAIWKIPSMYMLMYLQILCFTECIIMHTTDMYIPQYISYVKKKKESNITILKQAKNIMKYGVQISYTNITCGRKVIRLIFF